MTFCQWWLISGCVISIAVLYDRDFLKEVRSELIPRQRREGYSDRQIYAYSTLAFIVVITLWPFFVVRGLFK